VSVCATRLLAVLLHTRPQPPGGHHRCSAHNEANASSRASVAPLPVFVAADGRLACCYQLPAPAQRVLTRSPEQPPAQSVWAGIQVPSQHSQPQHRDAEGGTVSNGSLSVRAQSHRLHLHISVLCSNSTGLRGQNTQRGMLSGNNNVPPGLIQHIVSMLMGCLPHATSASVCICFDLSCLRVRR
jgi:hypothetical protein